MIAAAATSGAAWVSLVAAVVFLVLLGVVVVDRTRLKRRVAELERSEALLETDLADARRELAAVRDALRERSGVVTPTRRGGPGAPVG